MRKNYSQSVGCHNLFPDLGCLHWSALRLRMAGLLPSQGAHARTLVTSFETSEGSILQIFFFCRNWILFKIIKGLKRLLFMCGQRPFQHLTCAPAFAECKMDKSQKVVQRAVALVRVGVGDLWPLLASFTLRPDPTLHAYLPPQPHSF